MSHLTRVIVVLRKPESMTLSSLGNLLFEETRKKVMSVNEVPNKTYQRVVFDGEVNVTELSRSCQRHGVIIMPEIIETTTVRLNKEWCHVLMDCNLKLDTIFKPCIRITRREGALNLEGGVADIEEAVNAVERIVAVKLGRESEECARFEMQENVWRYIKFKNLKLWSRWNELLSPRTVSDNLIELSGNPKSIKEFTETFKRLQFDSVVSKPVTVPKGMGKNGELELILDEFSQKVLISWADLAHLELTGLHCDVHESSTLLEKFLDAHRHLHTETTTQVSSRPLLGADAGRNERWSDENLSAASGDDREQDPPQMSRPLQTETPSDAVAVFGAGIDRLEFKTELSSLQVAILRGDLTQLASDAIVNAANGSLRHFGGVAGAIATAAGDDLVRECEVHIRKHGPLPVTGVMHSTSGHMKSRVRFVIHAVGPIYEHTNSRKECQWLLERTFYNCFVYANDTLRVKSLAVPAISSGAFGVPWDIVDVAMYNALMSFDSYLASLSASPKRLSSISFVNVDARITRHLIATFVALLGLDEYPKLASSSTAFRENGHRREDLSVSRHREASKVALEDKEGWSTPKTVEYKSTCCVCNRRLRPSLSPLKMSCGHDCCSKCSQLQCYKCVATMHISVNSSKENERSLARSTLRTAHDSVASGEIRERNSGVSLKGNLNSHNLPSAEMTPAGGETSTSSSHTEAEERVTSSLIDPRGDEEEDKCAICMDKISNPKTLPCLHRFCRGCIDAAFLHAPKCPCCGRVFGTLEGNQPRGGKMVVRRSQMDLSGFQGAGCIQIDYWIPSGCQEADHPNPGRYHESTKRTAYLPGNAEGEDILKLLQKAFDARLIFTVGRSHTSGRDDTVVWNDIHHKTRLLGTYGYPDSTYLSRVRQELAAKGLISTNAAFAGKFTPASTSSSKAPFPPRQSSASTPAASAGGSSTSHSRLRALRPSSASRSGGVVCSQAAEASVRGTKPWSVVDLNGAAMTTVGRVTAPTSGRDSDSRFAGGAARRAMSTDRSASRGSKCEKL